MKETVTTLSFVSVAAALMLGAIFVVPKHQAAEVFHDEGQLFYPGFTDPRSAAGLEVYEFDAVTQTLKPFKVEMKDGKWRIPSHHNYPADGKDRLAKVAAGFVDVRKETVRSENAADHRRMGVVDPLDEKEHQGKGRRVTLKAADGSVLSDLIIGQKISEGGSQRYVRVPGEKRTYGAKIDVDVSTRFEDWIETDLLQVTPASIRKVTLDNYSIDEERGEIVNRSTHRLARKAAEDPWQLDGLQASEEVHTENVGDLVYALDDLKIVGVRPKPAGLSRQLRRAEGAQLTQDMVISLIQKGFYFTREGDLVSNEGELDVECEDGVVYTLRFGEVLVGSGEEISAGKDEPSADPNRKKEGSQNRYLFITTQFDPAILGPEPAAPEEVKPDPARTPEQQKDAEERYKKAKEEYEAVKSARESKLESGRKRAQELTDRFADWYYVISAEYFQRLRRNRGELVRPRTEPKENK